MEEKCMSRSSMMMDYDNEFCDDSDEEECAQMNSILM